MPTKRTIEGTSEQATNRPTAGGLLSMAQTLADRFGLRSRESLHDDEDYNAACRKLTDLHRQAAAVESDLQAARAAQQHATPIDKDVAALLADGTLTKEHTPVDQEIKSLEHQRCIIKRAIEVQHDIVTKAEYEAGRRLVEKHGLRATYQESLRTIHQCLIALEAACRNETAIRDAVNAISGSTWCPPQPYHWRPEPLDDLNGRGSIWLKQARESGYVI
jgi:hypothetical protein